MKKKQSKKHLKFYIRCMNNKQRLPIVVNKYRGGLCCMADGKYISKGKFEFYFKEDQHPYAYWADGISGSSVERAYDFTPLRQTIVLLLAAINNEL